MLSKHRHATKLVFFRLSLEHELEKDLDETDINLNRKYKEVRDDIQWFNAGALYYLRYSNLFQSRT